MKKILRSYWFPTLFFLAEVIFYWISVGEIFNPLGILLAGMLLSQAFTRNQLAGILMGSLFFLLNIWMLLALASELYKFEAFNSSAWEMLGVGLGIFLPGLVVAILMLARNSNESKEKAVSL